MQVTSSPERTGFANKAWHKLRCTGHHRRHGYPSMRTKKASEEHLHVARATKTHGSLEVISRYSRKKKGAKRKKGKRIIVPLTFHYLSLHTQAFDFSSQPRMTTRVVTQFNSLAGPRPLMRENRTPRDSGNRVNPKSLVRKNVQLPRKRKCRSTAAIIDRRVRRSGRRRYQRQLYRKTKAQANVLAGQSSAFFAQDPTSTKHTLSTTALENIPNHATFSDTHNHAQDTEYNSDYQLEILPSTIKELRVASLNCRGLASISKRERVIHTMKKHKLDILCMQETKVNSNSSETHDGYLFYWSSDISDDARNKARDLKNSGKAKADNPQHRRIFLDTIEHLGVGVVCAPRLKKYVMNVKQCSARNLIVSIKTLGPALDIVSTYTPQAGHTDKQATEKHYAELEEIMQNRPKHAPILILGDFNARLIKRLPHESNNLGAHIFGNGRAELDILSQIQVNNRNLFMEFCLSHNLVVKNTMFEKPEGDLITHRAVGTKEFNAPWDMHKYAQLDYILVNDQWKNAVLDAGTTTLNTIDTDHKLLVADVRVKLRKQPPQNIDRSMKFHTATPEHKQAYNEHIRGILNERSGASTTEQPVNFDVLNDTYTKAAKQRLPVKHPEQKRAYISESTWKLLEDKWSAIEAEHHELAESLCKQITERVKNDREQDLLAQLEQITTQGYKWEGLKRLRAKFTPHFTKFKDASGQYIAYKDYPEKAAEYLEQVQWKPTAEEPEENGRGNIPLQDGRYKVNDDPFTIEELSYVLSRIKLRKTPGEDKVAGELYKWLEYDNRLVLLQVINDCYARGTMETHHLHAVVVSIYKKGDSTNLANYRPISLLNICYKVMAALVKERLDSGLDTWLMLTQYGFRKKRSTSQAIYIARRLQDIAEKSKSSSTLILLDWEKAFDKVSQAKLLETLHRLKVPIKIIRLIKFFYDEPKFKVKIGEETSQWKGQNAGIRQGCPLSPYLFTLVMGAMFADIKRELNTPKQRMPIQGIPFAEILYADDTLIFGANTHCINILLHRIEKHSTYYGLRLNYDKCVNLTANQRISSVRFDPEGLAEGKLVPRKKAATYLGTMLTDTVDNASEISNRLGDCIATGNRLKIFWTKANTSVKWKIQVFNAIIRSKLLYGLECIQITDAEINRINAFQNKSLRRILHKPPTFIDRTETNQKMYDEIQQVHGCKFEHLGDTWKRNKLKLLGHILRASPADPLSQITFGNDYLLPRPVLKRRAGRPRADWVLCTFQDAFKAIHGPMALLEEDNVPQFQSIKDRALARQDPF